MRKILANIVIVLICLGMALSLVGFTTGGSGPANGAVSRTATSDPVGFSVHAIIPDNQIDIRKTHFDLLVAPNATQELLVEVSNSSREAITVTIEAISASTNRNGVIDYRTPDIRDTSLKIPFSEIARVQEPELTVPAGATRTAHIAIKMPATAFEGCILGGISITKQAAGTVQTDTDANTQSVSIENVYAYVIGVKLSETGVDIAPVFEYVSTAAGLVNYRPALIFSLRNSAAAIVKNLIVEATVYSRDGSGPLARLNTNVDMAPNSLMPLSLKLSESLPAGDYVSVIHLSLGGQTWDFEQEFTITAGELAAIEEAAVPTTLEMPQWAMIAIMASLTVPCFILLLLILFKRRRRDDEEEEEQKRTIIRS